MDLFNIIKNKREYWLVDQRKSVQYAKEDYLKQLEQILNGYVEKQIGYISLLMDESYENWLLDKGFKKISSIVEYTRDLNALPLWKHSITAHSLAEGALHDQEYGNLYELCRTGTANKNDQMSINQVMNALQVELGVNWRDHCYYFTLEGRTVGISIPHIEKGTKEEGRLFYFGVVPEMRGNRIGTKIHQLSLHLLKEMEATRYVGSTDVSNKHMIAIFRHNSCKLRDRKGIYRLSSAETLSTK